MSNGDFMSRIREEQQHLQDAGNSKIQAEAQKALAWNQKQDQMRDKASSEYEPWITNALMKCLRLDIREADERVPTRGYWCTLDGTNHMVWDGSECRITKFRFAEFWFQANAYRWFYERYDGDNYKDMSRALYVSQICPHCNKSNLHHIIAIERMIPRGGHPDTTGFDESGHKEIAKALESRWATHTCAKNS
jgi:hypothetical protein